MAGPGLDRWPPWGGWPVQNRSRSSSQGPAAVAGAGDASPNRSSNAVRCLPTHSASLGVHPRSSAFVQILRPVRAVSRRGVVPVPLTDIIEQELLATLDGTGDLQAVLERHAGSKGPLYAAVARATASASGRFAEVRVKLREAHARRREAEESATEAEKRGPGRAPRVRRREAPRLRPRPPSPRRRPCSTVAARCRQPASTRTRSRGWGRR